MLTDLLNTPVTIITREYDPDTVDTGGVETPVETLTETVGELQQQQRTEPVEAGDLSDTKWLLILPAGASVMTGDAVLIDDMVFEVVGDPWHARNPRTQQASHVEATLRRTRGTGVGS